MAEETKIAMKLEEESKPIKKMCEKLMDSINHELDKGIENVDTKELGEAIDMVKDLYEAKKEMYEACYYKQIMEAMEEHDFEDEEEIMDEGRRGYRGQPRSESGRFMSRGDGRRSNRGVRGRGRGRRGYEDSMMMYEDIEDWEEMERMRDMDRMGYGRMYYSGGVSSGGSMGGQSSSGMSGGSQGGMSGGQSSGGSRGYSESGNQGGGRDSREGRSGQSRRGYMETKEMHKSGSSEDKQANMKELEKYMKELSEDMTELLADMDASEKQMVRSKLQTLASKVQ